MFADEPLSLDYLRERIAFSPPPNSEETPATTLEHVRALTYAAIYFNTVAVTDFGGRIGRVRQEGLVEQVVAAAFQSFGGVDLRPEPFEKAAMLLRGITQGHPFTDGNKRTGFLLAAYFLDSVGQRPPETLDREAVVRFCLAVSDGTIRDIARMTDELRLLWQLEDA